MIEISPTLACADYLNLGRDLEILERLGVDSFHLDMMDGNFVPNYCLNWDYIRQLRASTHLPLDLHLMVTHLDRDISYAIDVGIDSISFHCEASIAPIRMLQRIRKQGRKAGLAINPATEISRLVPMLSDVDFILLMGVEAGFSGQPFMESTYQRIEFLESYRKEHALPFLIEVDGGLTTESAIECVRRGADILVAGALCIFGQKEDLESATRSFIRDVRNSKDSTR